MAWGNEGDVNHANQDMIGQANCRLEVTDPDEGDAAILAATPHDGANDFALRISDGKSRFEDKVIADDLTVSGVLELNGDNNISGDASAITILDELHVNEALFMEAGGQCEAEFTFTAGVNVGGALVVGPGDAAGVIDARPGAGPTARDLQIGTNAGTDDVVIGHAGHNLEVNSDVLDLVGALQVGPVDGAGLIDSGGTLATPRHLKIGANVGTDNIQLGNGNGVVDILQTGRMNSNGLVLNDAAAVDTPNTGCGLIFNDAGHGGAGDAIDFYTEGELRGWIDENGWNVPAP